MYQMYPPPFWGYPPQQTQITQSDLEKGMMLAQRLASRRDREDERKEKLKKRQKEDERRQAESRRARTLTSLEWFIIGVVSYPFVGPLYNLALQHAQTMVK